MQRLGVVVARVVFGAAVFLGMCAAAGAEEGGQTVQESALEGVVWRLSGMGQAGSQVAPASGSRIDLSFEQGRAFGSSGCNAYAGPYVLDGTALGIGMLASTQKACPEPLMKQEQEFLRILRAAATATVAGDTLTLSGPAGTLEFLAERELRLVGTWTLLGYNNGRGGVVSTAITSKISLTLDDRGRASGSSGCNTFTGSYEVDGHTIAIGPLATTRKMCAEADVMMQERLFLKALQAGTRIELRGDDLRLRNGEGATQVHFTRTPAK